VLAEAIIRGRPYSSPSEIATALNDNDKVAFGNRDLLPDGNKVQWSDAAAEEAFARVYESSTVRSRNFRVWVIGQAIAPTMPANAAPVVLSEVRRAFTIFTDPGARKTDGTIDATKFKTSILNENDF
jgi:selenophosphate synthetase-related protein